MYIFQSVWKDYGLFGLLWLVPFLVPFYVLHWNGRLRKLGSVLVQILCVVGITLVVAVAVIMLQIKVNPEEEALVFIWPWYIGGAVLYSILLSIPLLLIRNHS